ncbi:MAG: hypothetical protein COX77_04730, partial [Candidatus Komeilibacteria bacterium CG_4_10_14_0_2_um_filter_37_10]
DIEIMSGNVGIGTTSPGGKLQVDQYTVGANGNQTVYGTSNIFTNAGTDALYLGIKNHAYPNRGWSFRPVTNGVNSDLQIYEWGSVGTRMTIQSTGNVGIGTTAPNAKLEVAGALRVSGTGTNVVNLQTGSAGTIDRLDFVAQTTNKGIGFQLTPNGTSVLSKMALTNQNSGVNFGSIFMEANGANGYISPQSVGTPTTAITTLSLGGGSGSTNWANVIIPSGNVGIGTTAPGAKLEVTSASPEIRLSFTSDPSHYLKITPGTGSGASIQESYNASLALQPTGGNVLFPGSGIWNSAGNVGIGTTAPATPLDVVGSSGNEYIIIRSSAANANAGIYLISRLSGVDKQAQVYADWQGGLVINPVLGRSTRFNYNQGGTGGDVIFYDGGTNALMTVLNVGNVGIGTTAPGAKLELSATSGTNRLKITNTGTLVSDQSSLELNANSQSWQFYVKGNVNQMGIWSTTLGNDVMSFLSTGNVGIGTTSPNSLLDVFSTSMNPQMRVGYSSGGGYIGFGHGSSNGYITSSVGDIRINPAVNVILAQSSGNVGIGVVTPSAKLNVVGTADAVQFLLQGYSTQTSNIMEIKDSSSNNLFTLSPTGASFEVPTSFNSSGDTIMAYDLVFTNPTASTISSNAPLSIIAGAGGTNSNLTLSGSGTGKVYVDDDLEVTGTLTTANLSTTGNILPSADNTYDLGSTNLRWKTLHV